MSMPQDFLIKERKHDFLHAMFPFLVLLASAVILLCIFKDVSRVGARSDWMMIRIVYLPVATAACLLAGKSKAVRDHCYELPAWVCGSYIVWFCTHFASDNGNFTSDCVFGIHQYMLGIAVMPISRLSLYGFSSLSAFYYFWALSRIHASGTEIPSASVSNYVSFYLFYVLIFEMITRVRAQKSNLKFELQNNLENQDRIITRQAMELANAKISRAIADTTLMLAHDIRRPFSLLKMTLVALRASNDPTNTRNLIEKIIPEVEKVFQNVEGMLNDILEVGSPHAKAGNENVSPCTIVNLSIAEVQRLHSAPELPIVFQKEHRHKLRVDPIKVQRVLTNVLMNAVQASPKYGSIWLKTKNIQADDGKTWIEFCIGNSGSFISQEIIDQLFCAYFTKGKKEGTGLGLAVANKIVRDHGGKIWCTSSRRFPHEGGIVEFWFTLPASEIEDSKIEEFAIPKTFPISTPAKPSELLPI